MLRKKIKDKRFITAVAIVTAAIISLSGAFAWYSFNQRAQNEFFLSTIAPSVNLHDDFAGGPDKDVYVENNGDAPVLVRVRLSELLVKASGVFPFGAVDTDEGIGWHMHTPESGCEVCDFEAHDYFEWIMEGQKFYMPAHLSAQGDKSGDTEPIAVGEKETIIDYAALLTDAFAEIYADNQEKLNTVLTHISEYLNGDDSGAAILAQAIAEIPDTYTLSVMQYKDQPEDEYTRRLNEVRLTLIPSQIITMDEWISGGYKSGGFWVMDSDGWCYWADTLKANTATGQLLSACYYGNNYSGRGDLTYKINVVLNATTIANNDISTFFLMAGQNGGISEKGMIMVFLTSGDYILGEDGELYYIEGSGMYRKINKNKGSYVNFLLGEKVYAKPGTLPGGDGGFSIGGDFSVIEGGKMTDGDDYTIEQIISGNDGVVYLDVGGDIYFAPVDEKGEPNNEGTSYGIMHPGTDSSPGTNDDIGPIRAANQYPEWYFINITDVTDGDVIEAGQKGILIRADSSADVPVQTFGVEQSVYKVQLIVRGENGLLYLKLDEDLYAVALSMIGSPVKLTQSEDKSGERIPTVYYIVHPGESGKIGTEEDSFKAPLTSGYAGGDGSQESPYLIGNMAQLEYLRDQTNASEDYSKGKHFKQIKNIDLKNTLWTPIGNDPYAFYGVYDGDGYTISGLHASGFYYTGLFGMVRGGTVKNLMVKGLVEEAWNSAGGIAAALEDYDDWPGQITSCVFSGTIFESGNTGGIVGTVEDSYVSYCVVTADTKMTAWGSDSATGMGGIAGFAGMGAVLSYNYSLAHVEGGSDRIAGVVRTAAPYSTIMQCTFLRTEPDYNQNLDAINSKFCNASSIYQVGYFSSLKSSMTLTNNSEGVMPSNLFWMLDGCEYGIWSLGSGDKWPVPMVIRERDWSYIEET